MPDENPPDLPSASMRLRRRWAGVRTAVAHWGPARVFVTTAGFFLLLMVTWAALSRVDIIVRAEGRVVPAGSAQIIQHLEGGIVHSILVKEGEVVKSGQILMELSDIRARSDLGQGQVRLDSLRGREARLLAEAEGRGSISFPQGLDDREIRQSEEAALRARSTQLREEVNVLREQLAQRRGEINEAHSRRKNLSTELEVVQRQTAVIEGLRRHGAASQLELLDVQSRQQRLVTQLADTESSIPRLKSALAETERRINEAEAKFRAEARAELTQVRADLERVRHELDAGEDRLSRNRVTAPVAGYINRLAVNTIGGVVRPGDALMEITPTDSRVIIEGRVRPNDRANLRDGQLARIRFGAYDYATYGMVDGAVEEVSADTLADERGDRYYRLRLNAHPRPSHGLVPLPGMTVEADIVVGKRTILSYLLSPMLRFRDTAFSDPR